MPALVPATGAILDAILNDTFDIWNDGLTGPAYARFWQAQLATPWGERGLDRVALVDGETVLASLKRYALTLRIDGRDRRALGIGAVFTPPARRGRGFASTLIEGVLADAESDGVEMALLFSEIGAAYYERLGFVPVPLLESRVVVTPGRGAPAMLVRSGDDRDMPAVAEISAVRAESARLALVRSEDFIKYGLARRRLLAGLGPPGLRHVEFLVTEEGQRAVAFIMCSVEGGHWFIEDAGDRDPTGARVGAMLQTMLARTPAAAPPDIRSWWPLGGVPPQTTVTPVGPAGVVPMIRPLRGASLPTPALSPADIVYRRIEYF